MKTPHNKAQESPAAAFIFLHSILNVKEIEMYSLNSSFKYPQDLIVASAASSVLTGRTKYEVKSKFRDNHWILNGRKNICTGYTFADAYLVRANFKSRNTLYYVLRQSKGLFIGDELKMMGLEGSTGEILFKNVNIPAKNVVGILGKAEAVIESDNYTGLHFGILALGVAKRCLEEVDFLLKKRKINQYYFIQKINSEINTLWKLQKKNIRSLLPIIAKNKKSEYVRSNTLLYKNVLCSASIDLVHNLLTIAGKHGYIKHHLIESYLRDIYGFYLTYPSVWSAHLEGLISFLPRKLSNWSKDLANASCRLGPRV